MKKKLTSKRISHLKRTYGLSEDQYLKILENQNGKCGVCLRKLKLTGKASRLTPQVDHDHDTGKIRGILCQSCNWNVLPFFERDLNRLQNLHYYLISNENHYGYVPIKDEKL